MHISNTWTNLGRYKNDYWPHWIVDVVKNIWLLSFFNRTSTKFLNLTFQEKYYYKTIAKLLSFFQRTILVTPCFHTCCCSPQNSHDWTIPSDSSLNITSARWFTWMLLLYWVSLFCFPLVLWISYIMRCYYVFILYLKTVFFARAHIITIFATFQVLFIVPSTDLCSINFCWINE